MAITVDITKRLQGFTLQTAFAVENETMGLLGGSGSGKSMTLKCIAGVVTPDEGRIELNGRVLFDSAAHINLPPQQRNVGFLFQNYALFPTMTVEQNIRCGMHQRNDRGRMKQVIDRLYLNGLEKRYPAQLSGGQQQRTALARMLVAQPEILLLDEPFSALDTFLRGEMEREVNDLLHEFDGPALLVSHNRDEIYHLCDRIAVYDTGSIDAIGTKEQVFAEPKTKTAAILTGCRNVLPAERVGAHTLFVPEWNVRLDTADDMPEQTDYVGIRAHYCVPVKRKGKNVVECTVETVVESPFEMVVYLRPKNTEGSLCWKTEKDVFHAVEHQKKIFLHIPEQAVMPLRAPSRR